MAGRLGYTTPSVMTLMNAPLSAFDGVYLPSGSYPSTLIYNLQVLDTEDNWIVSCPSSSSNCQVQYKRSYTGLLLDVNPPNVFYNQLIEFHVDGRATQDVNGTPAEALFPFRSMSLGSTLVDQAELYIDGTRIQTWGHDVLPGYVGNQYPGLDSTPRILFHNGYLQNLDSSIHCNFAGDDCYSVKTHARIDGISAGSGFVTGGQLLTISGVGLNSTNVQVLVDGVECAVSEATSTAIKCLTGAATAASSSGNQPGQPGLKRTKTQADGTVSKIDLMTALNHFDLGDDTDQESITGWFTAPTTGLYRFYISCDQGCSFSIDSTNPYVAGATNSPSPVVVAQRFWGTNWRSYWYNKNEQQKSDWISLTAGESYFVAASTKVFSRTIDMTVSLEIQPTDPTELNPLHPKLAKTIQQLAKDPVNTPEQWWITVTNPDQGTFKINLLNPTTKPASYWQSSSISASATAAQFKAAISDYYSKFFSSNIVVTKEMYDVSSALTTDATLAVTVVYTVTLQKQIFGMSANGISITKGTTVSSFSVASPSIGGIKSSAPLNGTYAVQCTDKNNVPYTSKDINYNTSPYWIGKAIMDSIPFLIDKVQVDYDYRYPYWENGLSFLLQFIGLDYDVPLCTIVPGSGLYPLTGTELADNNTVIQHFGGSVFFQPITLDFLTSDAQSPQVLVTVEGIPALCANLNCDYQYVDYVGTLTDQSLSGTALTITGTSLPTTEELVIKLGPVLCNVISNTATSITCDLETSAVSGDWIVTVTSPNGLINNEITTSISIPVSVSSISPNTQVNYLGGDLLTITGDNFGFNASAVSVTFGDSTMCVIQSVSMTSITCILDRFGTASSSAQVTVAINTVSDNSLSVSMVSSLPSGVSMSPSSVSPVLKTDLTITLDSNYPYTLSESDFNVTLLSATDATLHKPLYVMGVDDSSKTLMVKFPGAKSGDYIVQVSSSQQGRLMSDLLTLTVGTTITGVTPLTGSLYGGALITITGENFSNEPLDNPVKIGSNYCYVITSSPTEITCRTDLLLNQAAQDELLLVFLKTSEEAYSASEIYFTYQAPVATVTDIQASYNSLTNKHQVVVTGTDLDASVELFIDGIAQEFVSYDSTSATFNVVGLNSVTSSKIQVFTSAGYPEGMEIEHTLSLQPTLISASPSVGSSSGSWVTFTGSGFGPQTQGLNIKAGSQKLCAEVEIVSYGVFHCLTNPIAFTTSTALILTLNNTAIASTVTASYSQSVLYPVTSSTLSGETITFTGSNFPTDGSYIASATFGGVAASTVTVVDSTSVEATWTTTGIAAASEAPVLIFTASDLSHWHMAQSSNTITKDLVISSSSPLSCSFAGGCRYSVAANGLFATLSNNQNSLQVCANTCKLRPDLSDSTQATCELPPLATTYSLEHFQIQQSGVLRETLFPNDPALYDDDVLIDHVDQTTTGCNFGMTFKQGHVAVLDQAKVFINFITDRTVYVNKLQFQGSNDNWATHDLIYTYGTDVHEGWNQIKFDTDKPGYNSYRFYGLGAGSCRVTEFRLIGVEAIADTNPTYSCNPSLKIGQTTSQLVLPTVTYDTNYTPTLTSINPRFGSVLGGTTVTLTGTNLLGTGAAHVAFDNRVCAVQSSTATSIVCITDDKPYVPDTPTVNLSVEGLGNVATRGLIFRYVSLWSEPTTWGNDLPPLEGESVSIPKGQHLLVDVNPPVLNAVIVEGSLIFAPNESDATALATFDAHYIMINGGYMEVGTAQFPYTSKIQITMYSDRFDPYLPMYGNKVIAVRFGTLDMHGVPRDYTWTQLSETALPGATSISLLVSPDWQVGEEIVIATTSFNNRESETRIITSISGNVVSFAEPLLYKHISEVPIYNGIEMPMQAEVGLLTRNVLFRGDPIVSPRDMYGGHIMVSSPGDESCVGRLTYIELKDVGQAFKLGRYPIHFHMIGTVHESLVQGNAIHQTYNRAVTTHGVHYFKVLNNVAFDTMGHTYFIEDAIESKNIYDHNLAVQVKASLSLLNSDGTPAGFWITFPDNTFTNNHVAGSDSQGFWFDLQYHSTGPSFDVNVCGWRTKLGQFSNNTAHSVQMYGFRIWHMHLPITSPCDDPVYDSNWVANGQTDPYWRNPSVTSVFENFVGYKCLRNGAITERTGAVIFKNFRIADSGIAAIEVSLVEGVEDNRTFIEGGLAVGNTYLNDEDNIIAQRQVFGFWGPRTENMTVTGLTFFNYEDNFSAAFTTCSHCFHPAATDSGGRTIRTSNLTFDDASVPRRIWWGFPYREIINDLDGTLTGIGANTYACPYYMHNLQPECTFNNDTFNGIICDPTVQIRRVVFHAAVPESFSGQKIKVSQWDSDFVTAIKANNDTYNNYLQDVDHTYFAELKQRAKRDPMYSWPVPFVTGHSYRLHWGEGIDFTQMKYLISNRWQPSDKNIKIMTNFTDVRAAINITDQKGNLIANRTFIDKAEADLVNGDNVIYNQTDVREFNFVINGKNKDERTYLTILGIRCIFNCTPSVIVVPISNDTQLWSVPATWPSGKVPVEGEDVEIIPGANILLDISTPVLNNLVINGRLTFLNNVTNPLDLTLNAKTIFVHAGELIIGNETQPYVGSATIKLYGKPTDPTLAFSDQVEGGNKVLAITGSAKFFGQHRDSKSRLKATVLQGQNQATVEAGLDWKQGDKVAFLPTATQWQHTDYNEIVSYDINTGVMQLAKPFTFYHWGASVSTAASYNGVDMRGEVIMLNRNVRIIGNDSDSWGGQVVVSDILDITGVEFNGQLVMDSVELFNCSQRNTFKAALRFEGANANQQIVRHSSIHGSLAWPFHAQSSSNVLLESTTLIGGRQEGIVVLESQNLVLNDLVVSDIRNRPEIEVDHLIDKTACIDICAYREPTFGCSNIQLTNTIVSGCDYAGFIVPAHKCGDAANQMSFRNNVAHSISGAGALIFPDPTDVSQQDCFEVSHYSGYKNEEAGLDIQYRGNEIRANYITLIDNTQGVSIQPTNSDDPDGAIQTAILQNSFIYGETEAQDCPNKAYCYCEDKFGFMSFGANKTPKPIYELMIAHLPIWKVMSYGQWKSDAQIINVTFSRFQSNTTVCGKSQNIFQLNPSSPDFIPRHRFNQITFDNVKDDAFAFIQDPPAGWNNPSDCIGFPCTAPSNVVMDFQNVKFTGVVRPNFTDANFQVIADTPGASEAFTNCQIKSEWNAWLCRNSKIGQLVFRAFDDNQEIRSVAPVYVTNSAKNFTNVLNSMMDHKWDGFYTGQVHKSQFVSFVETDQNYTVEYTSTPFNKMIYSLRADHGQIKVHVPYWNAGSYAVYVNDKLIPYTSWDKNAGSQSELTGLKGCGENRYVGVKNYLEFILTAGCEVTVLPVDAILTNVRMQWTMSEFYAAGGVVSFTDRVAAALGIHASTIKTVAVYTGSVVVEFNVLSQDPSTLISSPLTDAASASKLRTLKQQLNTLIKSSAATSVFGAPVLSASTDQVAVISDPNYNPGVNPTPVNLPSTPVIQNVTITNSIPQVTTESSQSEPTTVMSAQNQQLLWILLVLVLLCFCCFGFGACVICAIKATKKPLPVAKSAEGVVESEIDLNPQFNPAMDVELDIFSKKREIKQNEEYNTNANADLNLSEKKLISTDSSPSETSVVKELQNPQ